jgi:hypothetical protein
VKGSEWKRRGHKQPDAIKFWQFPPIICVMRCISLAFLLAACGQPPGGDNSPVIPQDEASHWRMALWTMTAVHHKWPARPASEAAPAAPPPTPLPDLPREERDILRTSLEKTARCVNGRVIFDAVWGFYVPELRKGCPPPSRPLIPG